MTVRIIRGDARHLPLDDASVDLIITSPPYFALRSYQDGGEHYAGQVGSEATPGEFLDALLECTAEMVRVLKPSGSLFVNLGDKYAGSISGGTQNGHIGVGGNKRSGRTLPTDRGRFESGGVPAKSLIGIPWRYALRCIDDLGLILRAEIIWSKPNGLPESVTDRVRRSHEQWFHMVRSPRYFAAVDEIREEFASGTAWIGREQQYRTNGDRNDGGKACTTANPLGKLPGSVWTVPTQPLVVPAHLGVDHFAAFPVEWPKRLILGWCPAGVCTACGKGRRPVVEKSLRERNRNVAPLKYVGRDADAAGNWTAATAMQGSTEATITGYACACPDTTAPTTPGVVLDPFGGTGTTALAAHALGRHGISVDLSADYCRLAEWRTHDRGEIARVLELPKPPTQVTGQAALFDPEEATA